MVQIDDALVSLDIFEKKFCCDLGACKGSCCIEGEAGAPLEEEEIKIIEELLPVIWDDLLPQAKEVLKQQGVAYKDEDGEWVTSIVNGKDCVFTCYEEGGMCKCAIERAYYAGKVDFLKPISCHLYPIRIDKYPSFEAINYHRWKICKAAEVLGRKEGIPIYQFLKNPLIRKYGEAWYEQMEIAAEELKAQGIIK